MIFAPYQAHELVTLDKLLSSLVEEEYCIAKQLLAIKIGGILDITDLKNSYDLSAEKLQEIRNLAEQYEPKKMVIPLVFVNRFAYNKWHKSGATTVCFVRLLSVTSKNNES